jgi:hypothetical protein
VDFSDPREQAFYKALGAEDELGLVARAHIFIEHELDRFIDKALMCFSSQELCASCRASNVFDEWSYWGVEWPE